MALAAYEILAEAYASRIDTKLIMLITSALQRFPFCLKSKGSAF
jgi:hypothetical protein